MKRTSGCQSALHMRTLCLCIALALLAPLLLLSRTTTAYAKGGKPKIVMIGDSYSKVAKKRGSPRPWPELTRKYLHIRKSRCTILRKGGHGFAKPHKRFLRLLRNRKKDPEVTDVLIVGGAGNDRFCSEREIRKWYRKTIKRLRKLYPNATIMHTITSWDLNNQSYCRLVSKHIPWYQEEAERLGVTYLYGCEDVMKGHPEYFSPDGRHPNQRGSQAIAKVVVEKIRKYNRRYAK